MMDDVCFMSVRLQMCVCVCVCLSAHRETTNRVTNNHSQCLKLKPFSNRKHSLDETFDHLKGVYCDKKKQHICALQQNIPVTLSLILF